MMMVCTTSMIMFDGYSDQHEARSTQPIELNDTLYICLPIIPPSCLFEMIKSDDGQSHKVFPRLA